MAINTKRVEQKYFSELKKLEHGKKPYSPEKFEKEEWKEMKESTTDPESGYYMDLATCLSEPN